MKLLKTNMFFIYTGNIPLTLLLFVFGFSLKCNAQNDSLKYWEVPIDILSESEIVTVSEYIQTISEVPANVKVITSYQIKNRGYQTLEDVLSDLPGFQFRNIQGFNSYVFIRGLPNQNNYIILMIDGVPVNEINSGGFYAGGLYNLNNIKQIEVIYGSASSLYGTNAVGGIINIITTEPEENKGFTSNTGYGTYNTFQFDGNYSSYNSKKEMGISFAGMYKHTDKMKLSGETGDYNWSDRMENFEYNHSFEMKLKYKDLSGGIIYLNKNASRTTNYKSVNDQYLDYGTKWNIRFITSYIKHNYKISDKISILSKVFFRDATVLNNTIAYILKADSTFEGDQAGYYRPNYQIGVDLHINYRINRNIKFIYGGNYEYERISNGFGISHSNSETELPAKPETPGLLNNNLGSIFLQGGYRFLKYFELVSGVRIDHSSVYNTVFTPRIGLLFSNNDFIIKTLYMKGFRAPKNWDYTYGNGNMNLKPEEIHTVELSSLYKLSDKMNICVSVYNNELYNGFVKNDVLNIWENGINKKIKGIETEISYSSLKCNTFFNLTYNDAKDKYNNKIPEIAEYTLNAGFEYRLLSGIFINVRSNYISKRLNHRQIISTGSYYIDDALIFNTSLFLKNISNFDIKFSVNNLFNTEYYHPSNTEVDRYRQPGRMLFMQITFHGK